MKLVCLATVIINFTEFPWNDFDEKSMKRAKYVCKTNERYKSDTPCLVKFAKIGERDYSALCGYKREKKDARKEKN